MDAVKLGPLVLSTPRLYAAVALLALISLAELRALLARRDPGAPHVTTDAGWAWAATLAAIVGARVGFVLQNLTYFRAEPLSALWFWQGGFAPWWGVVAAAAVAALTLARRAAASATSAVGVQRAAGRTAGARAARLGPAIRVAALPSLLSLATFVLLPLLLTPTEGVAVGLPELTLERLSEGGAGGSGERGPGERLDAPDGRPTVLNLWASWCVPCRRELPQLARAQAEFPEVRFLLVNQGESRAVVEAFLLARPEVDQSSVLLDPRQAASVALANVGLPGTYFFDADGAHVRTHVGEISGAALSRELSALLNVEPPVSGSPGSLAPAPKVSRELSALLNVEP